MAWGFHLFPFRTQKLSPSTPMVLGWRRPGRVGRCRILLPRLCKQAGLFCFDGSIKIAPRFREKGVGRFACAIRTNSDSRWHPVGPRRGSSASWWSIPPAPSRLPTAGTIPSAPCPSSANRRRHILRRDRSAQAQSAGPMRRSTRSEHRRFRLNPLTQNA